MPANPTPARRISSMNWEVAAPKLLCNNPHFYATLLARNQDVDRGVTCCWLATLNLPSFAVPSLQADPPPHFQSYFEYALTTEKDCGHAVHSRARPGDD